MTTQEQITAARDAKYRLGLADFPTRNQALRCMAAALEDQLPLVMAANRLDVQAATGTMSDAMLDRLTLTQERFAQMVEGIRALIPMEDPLRRTLWSTTRPNGLQIDKVSIPLGVVGVIYESRPNVTADVAALCIKTGNVCILRSGSAAMRTAAALVEAMQAGLRTAQLPAECITLLTQPGHETAQQLMTANGYVDVLIPRGGAGLIRSCVQNATVPCIQTGTGICHIYVDEDADLDKALNIVENAKTSRPSVCNAAEVCLVHRRIAQKFLPLLQKRLVEDRIAAGKPPVELRLDEEAARYISGVPAGEKDFDTEFLAYTLGVKLVDGVADAAGHISLHSTGHSEAIITENPDTAHQFTLMVDSAAVYVNASTRFTDGGEFGFGCEVGISTQKLHARGPMGLDALCSYKYIIHGDGQIR